MTPIIIGIVGLLLGFGVTTFLNRTANSKKIEEMNRQADLIVKEARLSAKRMTDEAEMASEKAISKAETANEKIKQKKIQVVAMATQRAIKVGDLITVGMSGQHQLVVRADGPPPRRCSLRRRVRHDRCRGLLWVRSQVVSRSESDILVS